jgi:hypothetical protein
VRHLRPGRVWEADERALRRNDAARSRSRGDLMARFELRRGIALGALIGGALMGGACAPEDLGDDGSPTPQAIGKNSPGGGGAGLRICGATSSPSLPVAIQDGGGPILSGNVNVNILWVGSWLSASQNVLTTFVGDLSDSDYAHINDSYARTSGAPSTRFLLGKTAPIPVFASSNPNFGANELGIAGDLGKRLDTEIDTGSLASTSGVYVVAAGHGIVFYDDRPKITDNCRYAAYCTDLCGIHIVTPKGRPFIVLGDATTCGDGSRACSHSALTPHNDDPGDSAVNIFAHELSEAVTNPKGGAWETSGIEDADNCAWTFGEIDRDPSALLSSIYHAQNGADADLRLHGHDYMVQRNWVNVDGSGYCAMGLPAPGDTTFAWWGVPASQLQARMDAMNGMIPVWIDAYDVNGAPFFNAIFRRNTTGRAWWWFAGLSAADVQTRLTTEYGAHADHLAVQMDSYIEGGTQRFFLLTYGQDPNNVIDWTKTINELIGDHQTSIDTKWTAGYRVVSSARALVNGVGLYSGIYQHIPNALTFNRVVGVSASVFNNANAANGHLAYLNTDTSSGSTLFTAIWDGSSDPNGLWWTPGWSSGDIYKLNADVVAGGWSMQFIVGELNGSGDDFYARWH